MSLFLRGASVGRSDVVDEFESVDRLYSSTDMVSLKGLPVVYIDGRIRA